MQCPYCKYVMCYVCRQDIGKEGYDHFCAVRFAFHFSIFGLFLGQNARNAQNANCIRKMWMLRWLEMLRYKQRRSGELRIRIQLKRQAQEQSFRFRTSCEYN